MTFRRPFRWLYEPLLGQWLQTELEAELDRVRSIVGGPAVTAASDARKRRRVVALQRWLLNPPMKLLVWLGLAPGHVIVETHGRRTGRPRRTVVGAQRDQDQLWIVAEQGHHAAWVRNLQAEPKVRVRHRARWRPARASIIDGDDPRARLATWHRPGHARLIEAFGTQFTTVQLDLSESRQPEE